MPPRVKTPSVARYVRYHRAQHHDRRRWTNTSSSLGISRYRYQGSMPFALGELHPRAPGRVMSANCRTLWACGSIAVGLAVTGSYDGIVAVTPIVAGGQSPVAPRGCRRLSGQSKRRTALRKGDLPREWAHVRHLFSTTGRVLDHPSSAQARLLADPWRSSNRLFTLRRRVLA